MVEMNLSKIMLEILIFEIESNLDFSNFSKLKKETKIKNFIIVKFLKQI